MQRTPVPTDRPDGSFGKVLSVNSLRDETVSLPVCEYIYIYIYIYMYVCARVGACVTRLVCLSDLVYVRAGINSSLSDSILCLRTHA